MYELLRAKNQGLAESMIQFTQELVRIPSASLHEEQTAVRVEDEMRALGYDQVIRDEAGNVVGAIYGRRSEPTLLLNSHMDTAATSKEEGWKDSPWSGRVEDGRLHGIGAGDCKGGVAAQVYAGALLKRSLLPLWGNLVVAVTVAEEEGRSGGVRTLLDRTLPQMELSPTSAVLGEPTDLGLYYGHDGWTELDIRVEGANPFHVDDAACAVSKELYASFQPAPAGGQPQEGLVQGQRLDDENHRHRATIRLARRLRPAENLDLVMTQVRHSAALVAECVGAVAVNVAVRRENCTFYTGKKTVVQHVTNAWAIDPYDSLMQRARHALGAAGCDVRTGKWALGRIGMATAGSVLVSEYDIPTIGYGPGNEEVIHAANEYVETDKLVEAAYGTAAIAHSLVGIPVCGWTSDEI